ncbi:MAG TPA: type II secretion system F family protein [Pyrinomonadaceae bacterium]|nr:type II secretion system F family protein [Pyrinomonadaceae bacterium]
MILLKVISTVCVLGSLYLLVVWTIRLSQRVYSIGQSVAREPDFSPPREIAELPIVSTAAKYGVSFLPLVRRLVAKNKLGVTETLADFETQLIRGGVRHLITPEQLYAATIVSGLFLGLMIGLLGLVLFGPIGAVFFGFPAGFIGGFFLPRALMSAHVSNRIALIEKRLPYAIEFMLLTMEANATFPMALEVYCEQMGDDDPLAQEFHLVLNDITAGIGIQTAFVNLGKRIDSDQLSALILAITAGLETGQPIAALLAVEADAARLRRYQNAEEMAKTAGTRAIFPLFLAVVAIIILIIGPMALKFAETPLMF